MQYVKYELLLTDWFEIVSSPKKGVQKRKRTDKKQADKADESKQAKADTSSEGLVSVHSSFYRVLVLSLLFTCTIKHHGLSYKEFSVWLKSLLVHKASLTDDFDVFPVSKWLHSNPTSNQ